MNTMFRFLRVLVTLAFMGGAGQVFAWMWEDSEEARAFESGNIAAVKRILADDTEKYYSGASLIEALTRAILQGQVELVKYLATQGWLDECRKMPDCHNNATLYAARNVKMLQYLVSKGFPVSIGVLSSEVVNLPALEYLCDIGIDSREKYKYDALLESLKKGYSYKGEARWGWGSGLHLMHAQWATTAAIAAEFIEKGECRKGVKPSSLLADYERKINALKNSDLPLVKRLFPRQDTDTMHPTILTYFLYEAVASGSLEMLRHLKDIGWLDQCKKIKYCRPVEVAASKGAGDDLFEFLLAEGFELDWEIGYSEGTPLQTAVSEGHPTAVKFLCQHGADPRQTVHEMSLFSIVRKTYGETWCALNSRANREAVDACQDGMGVIYAQDCYPGRNCRSVAFPSAATSESGQKLMNLAEVFHYLRSNSCNPLPKGQCKPVRKPISPHQIKYYAVIADSLKLREAPDPTSAIVRTLRYGELLHFIEACEECVTFGGRSGHWMKVINTSPSGVEPINEGWVFDAFVDWIDEGLLMSGC